MLSISARFIYKPETLDVINTVSGNNYWRAVNDSGGIKIFAINARDG